MSNGKTTRGVGASLLKLEKSVVRKLSSEDVDAYIEKVMRELLYPFFFRKRVHRAIHEFLCSEFGLDAALSEMPADQLSFRIGNPRDAAQDFAATCCYAWLRGAMPAWKKGLIVAALGVLVVVAVFLAVLVVWQIDYDHGRLSEDSAEISLYDTSDSPYSHARRY